MNELVQVGLATVPGVRVKAPRIAASPVHLECHLRQIIDLGANYRWVVGQVVLFHVADHLLLERGRIDIGQLAPLGRLIGDAYVRGGEHFELTRKPPTA